MLRDHGIALTDHLLEQDRIIGKLLRCRTIHDGRGCITPGLWSASG